MAEKDSSKERKTTDETKFDVSKIFSTPPEKPKTIIKSFNLKEENVKKLEEIAHAQNMSEKIMRDWISCKLAATFLGFLCIVSIYK